MQYLNSTYAMLRLSWLKTLIQPKGFIWDKVFKSGLSKFCGRQPLKSLLSPLLNTLSHLFQKIPQDNVLPKLKAPLTIPLF